MPDNKQVVWFTHDQVRSLAFFLIGFLGADLPGNKIAAYFVN